MGFGENGFWLEPLNTHFYQGRILVIASQYVNKQSQDFTSYSERIFRTHVLSHWSKSMAKQLSCRYDQCFGPFNMLTVHKCSDTRLFRHLSNHAFRSLQFCKYISCEARVSSKMLKILCRLQKHRRNIRKYFLFFR